MSGESGIKRGMRSMRYGNRVTTVIRFLLGGMLVFSGVLKIFEPDSFAEVIARYDIIPGIVTPYAAVIIPVLEVLLGLLLIVGFRIRASACLSMILMAVFTVAVAVTLARGRRFDCGCFEAKRIGLEFDEIVSSWLVIRDLIFFIGFALVYRAQRH